MDSATPTRLIVNADDFGRSHSINEAVIRAHNEGVLTTASLMATGGAFDDAVEQAHKNPRLGVGLHITLICGRSILKPTEVPGLVNKKYELGRNPAWVGFKYFIFPSIRRQLRQEMNAQFTKFKSTGLPLDHVNGHLHMHLHPTVFSVLKEQIRAWGIKHMRLTREPLGVNLRVAGGRWAYRMFHSGAFGLLSASAERHFKAHGVKHTDRVFGMLQDGRVNEEYILKLLPRLPGGIFELYSHPSMDEFRHEFDALVSPKVAEMIRSRRIELIRYQDI